MQKLTALRERAQGMVEYGLILAIVAIMGILGLIVFGPSVSSLISNVANRVAPPIMGV
jgi:Flp pilus assembly pilin Flp